MKTRRDHDLERALAEDLTEAGLEGTGALEPLAALLGAVDPEVDASALSLRALARLRPELRRPAPGIFWHRVAVRVALALLPLPLALLYGAWALSAVHTLIAAVLPSLLATYVVVSYAALLILLVGMTYAAIPLLVAKQEDARAPR